MRGYRYPVKMPRFSSLHHSLAYGFAVVYFFKNSLVFIILKYKKITMPFTKISLLKGKSEAYKLALRVGVHSALVEAFLVPDSEIYQQLYELDEKNFEIPSDKSNQFVIIEITAFQGRSYAAKKELYRAIAQNLGKSPGISGGDILIILHEPPKENWGIHGGKPASEVDLGFKIDV
jgi:phenylpyruvate tautomerase PptA (4-oxalocrotonate tautomerase family)